MASKSEEFSFCSTDVTHVAEPTEQQMKNIKEMKSIRVRADQLGLLLQQTLPGNSKLKAIVEDISGLASRALAPMENSRYNTKRRRRSWTLAAKTCDDGYTWRKYGEKYILGDKYPRSYFRCCTSGYYSCHAKRRVQMSNEDPSTFIIIYSDEHTCKKPIMDLKCFQPPPPAAAAQGSVWQDVMDIEEGLNSGFLYSGADLNNLDVIFW